MERVDHRHCLATRPDQFRCVVDAQREDLMRVVTMAERGPWQDDFDARPACAGRSLLERMEDRLDEIIWDLMVLHATSTEPDRARGLAGQAQGITECVALVRTPYSPDSDLVKKAAMERYNTKVAAMVTG